MTKLLFDYDPILFAASCVGEKRSIKAIHKTSGDEYTFKTRTDFWGHYKTKSGGWLEEYNAFNDNKRMPDEFEIVDIVEPEPFENVVHIANIMLKNICVQFDTKNYYGYSGRGKVFRHDLATILEYKGNRKGLATPTHLQALKDYFVSKHNCDVVTEIEADDAVSIDSYLGWKSWKKGGDKLITVVAEKDYYQCTGHIHNTNDSVGVCSYEGFGWLNENEKGAVKGRGRLWLYHQVMSADIADNYAANSASNVRWGEKSSYKLLKDCKDDKQAFEALVKGYKTLYPESRIVTGWQGDDIRVNWMYMLTENFNLAKLLRTRDEKVTDVKSVLDTLGVDYEKD